MKTSVCSSQAEKSLEGSESTQAQEVPLKWRPPTGEVSECGSQIPFPPWRWCLWPGYFQALQHPWSGCCPKDCALWLTSFKKHSASNSWEPSKCQILFCTLVFCFLFFFFREVGNTNSNRKALTQPIIFCFLVISSTNHLGWGKIKCQEIPPQVLIIKTVSIVSTLALVPQFFFVLNIEMKRHIKILWIQYNR